jgi:hypothetical protein
MNDENQPGRNEEREGRKENNLCVLRFFLVGSGFRF